MASMSKDLSDDIGSAWPIGQDPTHLLVQSDNMRPAGVGLGQLLLALDTTMVSLVEAPRGLDLARGADPADVFFLLGVADKQAQSWLDKLDAGPAGQPPVAIFVKQPSD